MKRLSLILGIAAFTAFCVHPQESYTRIVDVGPGLCSITKTPSGQYFIYDAGHWTGGLCYKAVSEVVQGNIIDLMILSHNDSDHIGDAAKILNDFNVKSIVHTGQLRNSKTWSGLKTAVVQEIGFGAQEKNLQTDLLQPGEVIHLGDSHVTLVYGKGTWTGLSQSENNNAISIVAKYEYDGKSVLFTGDTVGRRLTDSDDACKDAEKEMVKLHLEGTVNLNSDVVIVPHHGANNGSSKCFINAVKPSFVIYPAGHEHGHPTTKAHNRYLAAGIKPENILRTDLNDAESDSDYDFEDPQVVNCIDEKGDDDIEITFVKNKNEPLVSYRIDGVDGRCSN